MVHIRSSAATVDLWSAARWCCVGTLSQAVEITEYVFDVERNQSSRSKPTRALLVSGSSWYDVTKLSHRAAHVLCFLTELVFWLLLCGKCLARQLPDASKSVSNFVVLFKFRLHSNLFRKFEELLLKNLRVSWELTKSIFGILFNIYSETGIKNIYF